MAGSLPKLASADADAIELALARLERATTPTRQSMEAVRLAEEENRLAREVSEVSQVTTIGAVERGRQASDASGAFTLADLEHGADPFGGLLPVEDDPFGGLIPVEDEDDDDDWDPDALEVDPGLEAGLPIIVSAASRMPVSEVRSITSIVPRMLVGLSAIAKLPMDPRAAFILANVDGMHSVEEILDVCPMPQAEALELLEKLKAMGVITM